jgi:hypothetical protein
MGELLQLGQINRNTIRQAVDTQGGLVCPFHELILLAPLADSSGTSIMRNSVDWYKSSPYNHPVCHLGSYLSADAVHLTDFPLLIRVTYT